MNIQDYLALLKSEIRRLEKQQRRKFNRGERTMGLFEDLAGKLPPDLMPGNVGTMASVRWNFDFPLRFEIKAGETVFSNATLLQAAFQVPQEAALILTHMAVSFQPLPGTNVTPANAPLHIEIRDRQSSRQFMSKPLPIQAIGSGRFPTILPAKMIFMPTAFVDVEMRSFADGTYDYANMTGFVNMVCYGVRIRIKDAKNILGTVFA
jgi:hypothetical protein